MPFRSEHNTVKHPTGIPLTLSNIPKVEAAWGYGGDWLAQLPVPCWSTVGARHGQIARAARRGGTTELVIIHLPQHSFKLLHYLFVLFSKRFCAGNLAEEK